MTSDLKFGTISNPEEAERLGKILTQCFNTPQSDWDFYRDRVGLENFRVLRKGGEIIAGLAIYQMGQWWGNQRVPMAGIAAVGVPPEHRGTGAARELMVRTLKELHAQGVPISALYPATQRLYRQVGYEQGGTSWIWEVPTASIAAGDRALPMQRVEALAPEVFQEIYRQQARKNNGNLDRVPIIWQSILNHRDGDVYAYLLGSKSQPEGYIIFSPKSDGNQTSLLVWDWAALTPAAKRRLWTFIADHRSQIQTVKWRGSECDPLLLLLPEQTFTVSKSSLWFLRAISVVKALEMRGYPAGIEAELHLAVRDDLLPENSGNFILAVSGGRGEVSRGGRGDLQLDIRALTPLYTGLFTPYQLQSLGQLQATDEALGVAARLFAGDRPWLADFF